MTENDITGIIVDCCLRIHKTLGPGLLESVYEELLAHELKKKGLRMKTKRDSYFLRRYQAGCWIQGRFNCRRDGHHRVEICSGCNSSA